LQVLAWFTPLFHGVALTRALSLGVAADEPVAMAIHIAYLSILAIVGGWLTVRFIGRRLVRG
jgi:lipooligosaccharide transport system permease protein